MTSHTTQRLEALGAFARLARSFRDSGLRALERAAVEARLVRGAWSTVGGGCPLSCADGALGRSGPWRFFWQADDRNRFIVAWDAGLVSAADVVALAQLEQDRRARASQPSAAVRAAVRRLTGRLSARRRPLATA
jgi:hypothetical protein